MLKLTLTIVILFSCCVSLFEAQTNRPQTPQLPLPYNSENVRYKNTRAKIELAGTITYSKTAKPRACVVLAHGSGGHTRDQVVAGHYTFTVLADLLTKNNIAVLRFDERGIGESSGNFSQARYIDFADDVIAGLEYLSKRKEFKGCKLGVVGISKGGPTAMLAANRSKLVKFIVILSSPGIDGERILYRQIEDINRLIGTSETETQRLLTLMRILVEIVKTTKDLNLQRQKMYEYVSKNANVTSEEQFNQEYGALLSAWTADFLRMQPKEYVRKLHHTPVLGIWGSNDVQVIADDNMKPIKEGLKLARNRNVQLIKLNGLNHFLQNSTNQSLTDYATIEETISPKVIEIITKWIRKYF